jgi:hypothetical protein
VTSIVSGNLPFEGAIPGKQLNHKLIRTTVTGYNLFDIPLERYNKNPSINRCLNNITVTFVHSPSEEKYSIVQFKCTI